MGTARCLSGTVELELFCAPVFDYGRVPGSWQYVEGDYGHARAHAGQGDLELTLRTDMRLGFEAWGATARRTLPAPGGSTVVEHRGAEQLQLRCSTQTAGGPIADGHPSCSRP